MHLAAVHMPEHNTQHDELWHANARLIAAAPDLLDSLTALLERAEDELADPQDLWEITASKEAIAKAKGEPA